MIAAIDVECKFKPKEVQMPWHPDSYLSSVAVVTSQGEKAFWTFTHKEADVTKTDKEKVAEIQKYVDASDWLIAHNFQYDYTWLRWLGVNLTNAQLFDTMVAEYLIQAHWAKMKSLDELAEKYLGEKKIDKVKELWYNGVETRDIPLDILKPYNLWDCELDLRIAKKQIPVIRERGLQIPFKLKMDEIPVLVNIQENGLLVDDNQLEELEQDYERRLELPAKRLEEITGRSINLDSPAQLSALLYGGSYKVGSRLWYETRLKSGEVRIRTRRENFDKQFKNPIGFTPIRGTELANGGWSTSVPTLKQLKADTDTRREVKRLLLERSADSQTLKAFIRRFRNESVGGIIHAGLNQTSTRTGRYSSSFHNTPRDGTAPVKKAVFPQLGYFVSCDASQLEWKVAAFLSQDKIMCQEILDGIDNHAATGRDHFGGKGKRPDWKIFNFRMIYGGSPYSFYMDYKMPNFSQKKWEFIWASFFEKYYGLKEFQDGLVDSVYRNKGFLRGITGRIFRFKLYNLHGVEGYKRPEVVNYPVQSFATADIIPLFMLALDNRINQIKGPKSVRMCMQVHDDVMFDVAEEYVNEVARICQETVDDLPLLIKGYFGIDFNLPLGGEVKVGPCWGEMKPWERI